MSNSKSLKLMLMLCLSIIIASSLGQVKVYGYIDSSRSKNREIEVGEVTWDAGSLTIIYEKIEGNWGKTGVRGHPLTHLSFSVNETMDIDRYIIEPDAPYLGGILVNMNKDFIWPADSTSYYLEDGTGWGIEDQDIGDTIYLHIGPGQSGLNQVKRTDINENKYEVVYEYPAFSGKISVVTVVYARYEVNAKATYSPEWVTSETENVYFESYSEFWAGKQQNYEWYLNGTHISSESSWSFTKPPVGKYDILLKISNEYGNTDEHTLYLWVYPANSVEPDFVSTPEVRVEGRPVTFKSTSNLNDVQVKSYTWYLNGEQVGTGQSWTWANPLRGDYKVKLEIKDIMKRVRTEEKDVYVGYDDYTPSHQIPLIITIDTGDRTEFLGGEKVSITGIVTQEDAPVSGAAILVNIVSNRDIPIYNSETKTNEKGQYTVSVLFPNSLSQLSDEGKQTTYYLDIKADIEELGLSSTQRLEITTKSHLIKPSNIHLVQVIDQKGETPLLAVDKRMGVRIYFECIWPSDTPDDVVLNVPARYWVEYENHENLEPKDLDVTLTTVQVENFAGEQAKIGQGYFDFIFIPKEGPTSFNVELDPNRLLYQNTVLDDLSDQLKLSQEATGKLMNPLDIKFVMYQDRASFWTIPYDYPAEIAPKVRDYKKFFLNVFPTPYLTFTEDKSVRPVPLDTDRTPIKQLKWTDILRILNKESMHERSKVVGIMPNGDDWFGTNDDGVSYVNFFYNYPNAVLVKYRSGVGVPAHELTHTYGIHKDEEYDWPDPPGPDTLAYYISGTPMRDEIDLIFKNGHIYDLKDPEDVKTAFGKDVTIGGIYCYAGDNRQDSWVCEYTYNEIFRALMDPPNEPVMYIQGVVYENKTVELDSFYELSALPDLIEPGNYSIRLVSENGETVSLTKFGSNKFETYFGFLVPSSHDVTTVEILEGDTVLSSRTRTTEIPIVTSLDTETLNDNLTISWTSTDTDSTQLTTDLLYSNTGGDLWETLALSVSGTQYSIPIEYLPGGEECMVKLVVTDGFNTVNVISNSFGVQKHTPDCYILEPESAGTYSETIILDGYGFDYDDGLIETDVDWSSDIDGYLGNGSLLRISNLSPGTHTVSMAVTDSDNNQAIKSVVFTVLGGAEADPPSDNGQEDPVSDPWTITDSVTLAGIILVPVLVIWQIVKYVRNRKKVTDVVTCTTCGKPASWIEEHKRWYCHECEEYL